MSDNGDIAAAGLTDVAVRSKFGLDTDDETWLERCRQAGQASMPVRLGTYELLGEAGRGSQGSVYKAVQPGTGRIVAIKRLGAGRFATARMRARFELEIVALASLSHPGIVTVFGADEVDEHRILLMEWIDGVPIDDWARERPVRERLRVLALTCDAIAHAHRRGVIHRDLKPSNILVDAGGQPHVLDFGLARLLESDRGPALSQTQAFVGTPAYAAPEQLAGRAEDIDTRTDVYALGVVLYELVTGAVPFRPGDLGAMVDAIRHGDVKPPSVLSREVGAEADAIALKALAKEPGERYQSVTELGEDVRRYLAGDAVVAHPPSRAYRARKFVRRHRAGVVAYAAVMVALIAGAAATTVQAVRAKRAEAQAAHDRDSARLEARRADAVRDFLTTMLGDTATPSGGSSTLTVREALDRAAAKLDAGALKEQPEVEDAVRWTLGLTYTNLRERAAAAAQYEWVVRYRERTLGVHPSVADAMYWWGGELHVLGEMARGEEVFQRCMAIYDAVGPGKWQRLHPLMGLAEIARKRHDPAAEGMYLSLVEEFAKQGYPAESAWAVYGLGLMYRDQGRQDEFVAALEKARPVVERKMGAVSRKRLWFFIDYCLNVLEPAGRHEETIAIMRPLVDASLAAFSVDDVDVARMETVLAPALIETGRSAEAEPRLQRLVASRGGAGPAGALGQASRSLLGAARGDLGWWDEAEGLLVEAFEALDALQPPNAYQRGRALKRVIRFYESVGREEEAARYRARLEPG